jgi:hypothetical protein
MWQIGLKHRESMATVKASGRVIVQAWKYVLLCFSTGPCSVALTMLREGSQVWQNEEQLSGKEGGSAGQ